MHVSNIVISVEGKEGRRVGGRISLRRNGWA